MSNNLIVNYDLVNQRDYDKVIAAIKKLGTWSKPLRSCWYVSSTYSASEAAKLIWSAMDQDDKLLVIDSTNDTFCGYNLGKEVANHMQRNWSSTTCV